MSAAAAAGLRVALLATMDPTVRDLATLALACDLGDGVEVRHDLVTLPDGNQQVRCTVSEVTGIVYREDIELEHGCLSCTVREGLVPTLRWVAAQGRWRRALVTLPVTGDPEAVSHQLHDAVTHGELDGVHLAQVMTVVDQDGFHDDLLGDDLLEERGLELSDVDARAVGEALSSQLDHTDVVVTLDAPDARTDALLEHVLPPETRRVNTLCELDVAAVFDGSHDPHVCSERCRPSRRKLRCHTEREGVWTLELASPKAFHPQRLLDQIELLGSGEVRSRGCFWLPSRPGVICLWDGSGGQLSIGEAGIWNDAPPRTRILVTGTDLETRARIERAFRDVLLTDHEEPDAISQWAGREDGLEHWLGEIELPWLS